MKIIIVDDEEIVLEGMQTLARRLAPDSVVEAYSSARGALAAIEKDRADVAILDIEMPEMSGLELALECKSRCPYINLIFATGYSEYAAEAFGLRASGYLLKPVREGDMRRELENLRNPVAPKLKNRPRIRCFGNFEIFMEGEPVVLHRSKGKEILAYLTDRRGAAVTTRELAAILWEDRVFDLKMSKHLSNIIAELISDLDAAGAGGIVGKRRGELFLRTDEVDCDYFRLLEGDVQALNSFHSEYMTQYPWSEFTLGSLLSAKG